MRAPNLKDVPIAGVVPDTKEALQWIESLTRVTRKQLNRAALIVDELVGHIEDHDGNFTEPKDLARVSRALRSARKHLDCARRSWLLPELKKHGVTTCSRIDREHANAPTPGEQAEVERIKASLQQVEAVQ